MRFKYTGQIAVPILLLVLAAPGCNKAELQELADKAKSAATSGAESVKEQVTEKVSSTKTEVQETLQMAGKIELQVDQPLATSACYARFHALGPNRPAIFELRSYSEPQGETPPSIYFHAQVSAASMAELAGQVVSGRLFVQPTATGPTWYSATGSPVELQVTSLDDSQLIAEIVNAPLQNTETGASLDATGTFTAVHQ